MTRFRYGFIAQGAAPAWVLRAANGAPAILDLDWASGRWFAGGREYTDFDVALAAQGGTFARASTATYFDSSGVLKTAASGELRFDHAIGTGTARGILLEGQRTWRALWNRDFTNAVWAKTNVTAAKDQAGIDDAANGASSLTATADAGTCLQSITHASAARAVSAYVKRLAGSGSVEMTMDNGSTWTAISPTAGWTRATIPAQTLANPTVGFRLGTSGDAIAVDFLGCEDGVDSTYPTSPVEVTSSAVTRAEDVLKLASAPFSAVQGTIVLDLDASAFNDYAGIVGFDGSNRFGTGGGNLWNIYCGVSRNGPTGLVTDPQKVGVAWSGSGGAAVIARDGVLGTEGSCGTMTFASDIRLGAFATGGSPWQHPLRFARLTWFNQRLSDADLQGLTSS